MSGLSIVDLPLISMKLITLFRFLVSVCMVYLPVLLTAQNLDSISEIFALRHIDTFRELLSIPNDAHFPEQIEKNIIWCESVFTDRGFKVQRLQTEGPPLLLAERRISDAQARTVLVYLQLDGQPVDPEYWFQDDPYTPVLKELSEDGGWESISWDRIHNGLNRDWRIFARSASDAKGPVSMFFATIDALDHLGRAPTFHMKVIMDFEEELGSPHLPDAVKRYRETLSADMLLIFDGPMHLSNQPTLSFGARGISTITLTVYGPTFPLHSGHYGNYAPNPALRLCQLIGGMKDEYGRVTIPGFYEGVIIDDVTKSILSQVPDDPLYMRSKLGIGNPDSVAGSYQESLQYPSLNVRGMTAGWVGEEARTIIPSSATAEIDIRLVVESNPVHLLSLVHDYIVGRGYLVLDRAPTLQERMRYDRICSFTSETSYMAFRTDFNSHVGRWLYTALTAAFKQEPLRIRTEGGSIPISPFVTTLNLPAVAVPTVNRDNNQHSPNENLRLGNYVDGIKTMLAIFLYPVE